jgi:hypothetical protein
MMYHSSITTQGLFHLRLKSSRRLTSGLTLTLSRVANIKHILEGFDWSSTKWITLSHANAITHTKIRSDNKVKHSIVFKQFGNFENSDTFTKVNYP